MNDVDVQFLFDFGSPNAYLCHKVIPEIEARTGVKFRYVPILLGGLFRLTGNRSPAEAFAGIKNKREYDRLEVVRFTKRHGLDAYKMNPHFPVNTLQMMRGAVGAQHDGPFEKYVDLMFAGMWEREMKLDDPEVIKAALEGAGLDSAKFLEWIQDASVKEELIENTRRAFDQGAFGSPTFLVGSEIFFGKDRLREVEEEIVTQLCQK
ncbi:2-hydroxychromene-2-carboxylate isomerase [Cupriavidus sp. TMH.W2]|uniref:2-hydroxychromene-2-carboxylate isomerase n=1 Tax=Cupriavidus sp. TMH.W2 TaxID=3434465 RepID=UPI003D781636